MLIYGIDNLTFNIGVIKLVPISSLSKVEKLIIVGVEIKKKQRLFKIRLPYYIGSFF
jgi:hypothetical protein